MFKNSYEIFFYINIDAIEKYIDYEETDVYNLNYEENCIDYIREYFNEKYGLTIHNDIEDEDNNYFDNLFIEYFEDCFETTIEITKLKYILNSKKKIIKFMNNLSF